MPALFTARDPVRDYPRLQKREQAPRTANFGAQFGYSPTIRPRLPFDSCVGFWMMFSKTSVPLIHFLRNHALRDGIVSSKRMAGFGAILACVPEPASFFTSFMGIWFDGMNDSLSRRGPRE